MKIAIFFFLLCLATLLPAQDHRAGHDAETDIVTSALMARLSPELQALLRKEMLLLQEGLSNLSTEIPRGGWESVAEIAAKMRDSYILKQSLTPDQKKELGTVLPPGFVQLDRRFHQTAGKLAHAAHNRDAELAVFYQARMLEACTDCHAQFTPERFPGLARAGEAGHDH